MQRKNSVMVVNAGLFSFIEGNNYKCHIQVFPRHSPEKAKEEQVSQEVKSSSKNEIWEDDSVDKVHVI